MGEPAELRSLMPFNCTRKALKEWNQIVVHSLILPVLKRQAVKVIEHIVGIRKP